MSTSGVGSRVVVTGMAGAGKSTFSKKLATRTGLPLIHLDLYSWQPGWVRVPSEVLYQTQQELLSGQRWIIDSNDVDDDLMLAHADTFIVIATPWWLCSMRAFRRGLRRPPGSQLPDGCDESFSQRIRDEWGIVWRNFRNHRKVNTADRALAERASDHMTVHVLDSKQQLDEFLRRQA